MISEQGFSFEAEGALICDGDKLAGEPISGMIGGDAAGGSEKVQAYETRAGILVRQHAKSYPGSKVVENWATVTNNSSKSIPITRLDSMRLTLAAGNYTHLYFTSDWGKEFSPVEGVLAGTKILESTAGRSSRAMHPYSQLRDEAGNVLVVTIAWSGNWIIRYEPLPDGRYVLTAGLSNWLFSKTLQPGESLEGAHCMVVKTTDADKAYQELARWGKKYWYPSNRLSSSLPIEWNHWWPYEDTDINEATFKANVDECQKLGVEVCTLDAGWFGPANDDLSRWYEYRGDWHNVVVKRFPSGIRHIADYVHSKGMKFGLWCEIEACGWKADLNKMHPEFVALRDGKPLGYVCLGNHPARDWAFAVLERLIVEYKADWIKLDFNLDPRAGCNRTDHGHQHGDGLYEHYRGYYELLMRVRAKYPEVFLENCASGGLRIDLGIMRQCHCTYLSDPDFPAHDLQIFWGATKMLHPMVCLHWSWSQPRARHSVDPIREEVSQSQFDYFMRISMLNGYGFSYRLPLMSQARKERLKYHNDFYKDTVRRFLRDATLYHLTGQALRDGGGSRWNAFMYVMDGAREALLFVFRIDGSEQNLPVVLKGLAGKQTYRLQSVDQGEILEKSGDELCATGIRAVLATCESSDIYLVTVK